MMRVCMVLCLSALTLSAFAAPPDIATTKVIGTEYPGAYKHPASITQLDNGDLYLAYYGGPGEYSDESRVWGMRQPAGSDTWSTPAIIADTPFLGEGNAVVWQAPDGLVWLFYVQRYGPTWSDSRIQAKISRDGAKTWSDNLMISFELGMMVRSRPLVLANGNYLLPIYCEKGHDREIVGAESTSLFLIHDPQTRTWTESSRIHSRIGNIQPEAAQLDDGRVVAYMRRGGGYGPGSEGFIVRSESKDDGKTWSEGVDSPFPNPNAAVCFLRLQNGHLLLVFNDSGVDRTPLTAAISTDGDKTYAYRRNIAEGPADFAYPYTIQTRDGKIHVIHTTDERATILHTVFDEEAILSAGK